jgi:hypothetical protein
MGRDTCIWCIKRQTDGEAFYIEWNMCVHHELLSRTRIIVHQFVYIGNFIWNISFGETIFLTLTCYVYNNIVGLVRKVYHGCKCCVTYIKTMWSNHLQKLVYDCSRVFLVEHHPYRIFVASFNGKPERTQRPKTMTLTD